MELTNECEPADMAGAGGVVYDYREISFERERDLVKPVRRDHRRDFVAAWEKWAGQTLSRLTDWFISNGHKKPDFGLIPLRERLKSRLDATAEARRDFRAWTGRRYREAVAAFCVLPRNVQCMAVVAVGLGVTTMALVASNSLARPVLIEGAIGKAEVIGQQTSLTEAADPSSKRIAVLVRGTAVDVLGYITNPNQRYVRVRVISGQGAAQPGYVPVAALCGWSSSDPETAWEFLSLERPGAGADERQARRFLEVLELYAARFAGTAQSRRALLEEASLRVALAESARMSSRALAEVRRDLEAASDALNTAGPLALAGEEAQRLQSRISRLMEQEDTTAAAKPAPSPTAGELRKMSNRFVRAYYNGQLETMEELAAAAESLDPGSKEARLMSAQLKRVKQHLR